MKRDEYGHERDYLTGPTVKHIPSALCALNVCFCAILAPSQNVTLPSESDVTIVWSLSNISSV